MRLVVIGGVAAGLSAAARARRLDRELEIIVLEKGARISYGACGLPFWFEGHVKSVDDLVVNTPQAFSRERNIAIRTNSEVKAVRHVAREVILASGERLHYDRLVWAGGARPASKPADPRLHVLHTDTDAEALMADVKARRPATAAVVGAGYIGLEMVEAFRSMGLKVALYTAGAHFLRRRDDVVTKAILERLERSRVEVHLNSRIESPSQLNQDLILWATGLKPNVELLADAGADLGRTGALRVSDRMETSIPGVYAAGDCCETINLVTGRPAWMPLGTTANKMGRVAGANIAGRIERFPGIVGTSIVRVCGLGIGSVGLCAEGAKREGFDPVEAVIEARERPRYFRGRNVKVQLIADRGSRRLLGAAILGDEGVVGRVNTLAAVLTARMKAEDLENLDLAYAPPYATVMDPIVIAAQQLLKKLDDRGW